MMLVVPFEFSKGKCKELEFLIDTGSEMNLIRKDVVPRDCWKNLTKKINFYTASGTPLGGGSRTCSGNLLFRAAEVGKEDQGVSFQQIEAMFYEAEICCDGILSYEWVEKIS